MPGFSATNSYHNEAIISYKHKGAYFIVLNPVGDGTIQKDIINEIQSIVEHNRDFTFCLSKTNLFPSSTIQKVKENNMSLLEDFDYDKDIVCLGASDGDELLKALKSIDIDKIFKNIFYEELKVFNASIFNTTNKSLENLTLDKKELEARLDEFNKIKEKIENTKNNIQAIGYQKYANSEVEKIIRNTKNTLHHEISPLASRAINGVDVSSELVKTLEGILSSNISNSLLKVRERIVSDYELELSNISINHDLKTLDLESIKNIARAIDIKVEKIQLDSIKVDTGIFEDLAGVAISILSIFKNIPIVNVVTSALTGLIGIFGGNKDAEAREEARIARREAEERAKSEFKEEVISKVGIELNNIVPNIFKTQVEELSKVIAKAFDDSTAEQRAKTEQDLECISQDKSKLDEEMNYLKNLSNTTLELKNKYFKE